MQLSHAIIALLSITAAGTTAAPIRQSRSVEEASGSSLSTGSVSSGVARRAEAVAAAVRSLSKDSEQLQPSVLAARYTKLPAIQRLRLDALDDLHRRGQIDALTHALRSLTEDLVHAATTGAIQRRQTGTSAMTSLQPVVASITCLLNTLLGVEDPLCDSASGTSSSGSKAISGMPTEKAAHSSQTLADVLTAVAHGLEHGVAVSNNATAKQPKLSKSVNGTAKVNATADAASIAASLAALPAGASTATIIPPASLKENRAKEVDHGSRRRSLEQLESTLRRLADVIPAAPVKRAAMDCKALSRTAKDTEEATAVSSVEADAESSEDEGTAPVVIAAPTAPAQNATTSAQNSTSAVAPAPTSSTQLANSTNSAPAVIATMAGKTQVKQSIVASSKSASEDGSFPIAPQLQAAAENEAEADDEGAAEEVAEPDDEVVSKEDETEVEPVEAEPVEPTDDKACPEPGTPNDGIYRPNCPGYGAPSTPAPAPVDPEECPPAGAVNDGIYRPNCPGYGAPNPVPATPEPEPTPDPEACPPAGTPNDGMWRPNCPGYGGRRDVAASLNRREQSLLVTITPLLNELIKDVSSYLMKTAPAANTSSSAAHVVKPLSAAKLTITSRDLLGADGFQAKMVCRQAALSSASMVPAAPMATTTVGPSILDNLLAGLLGSSLFKSTPAQNGTQKLDVQGLRQLVNFALDRFSVAVTQ